MNDSARFLALALSCLSRRTLRLISLSKPLSGDIPEKTVIRVTENRGGCVLSVTETLPAGKIRHASFPEAEAEARIAALLPGYGQILLSTGLGDARLLRNKKGTETLLGAAPVERRLAGDATDFETFVTSLDREKTYLIGRDAPFLRALGVADATGRIHDKKQAKYRQINRFTEHLDEIYSSLPKEGVITVYDLCSGKSYLSFAVYHYLKNVRGRDVDMLCMDLKADVMDFCRGVAEEVGFSGMRFIAGDIRKTPGDKSPDLVLSLHACDIATDIVLDTAIRLGAKVILSTPCCHRYLTDRITMPALDFVTKHPYLKTKLAEVLTEGIRLARLERAGYRVTALEMTDPDDTPKNTLLRAIRKEGFDPASKAAKDLADTYDGILKRVVGDGAKDYLSEILP